MYFKTTSFPALCLILFLALNISSSFFLVYLKFYIVVSVDTRGYCVQRVTNHRKWGQEISIRCGSKEECFSDPSWIFQGALLLRKSLASSQGEHCEECPKVLF